MMPLGRSRKIPHLIGGRHGKECAHRADAEHRLAVDLALLADFHKIEEQRPCHLRPQVAADMEIRLQSAGAGFRLEAQRVLRPARYPIVDIGAKVQHAAFGAILDIELDGEKRRVVDSDAALLHRRNQEVTVALALEPRGDRLHQRRPADRRLHVEPGAVGGDAHIEIAAERRVPALDRRWGLSAGPRSLACYRPEAELPFRRHSLPRTYHPDMGPGARLFEVLRSPTLPRFSKL